MATRAQVSYLTPEGNLITTYNHYDGYPEHLGKALNDFFNDDSKAKQIASTGYISYVDGDTGEVESKHKESPDTITGMGSEELLSNFYDHAGSAGADYAYIWDGRGWNHAHVGRGRSNFISTLKGIDYMDGSPSDGIDYDDENFSDPMIGGEGLYESKWKNFLNEGSEDVVGVAASILRDKPNLDVYLDSLKNDIRLNGAEDYYGWVGDDFEEDYENYMADKMDY
jgi:hypothetical protein